MKKWIRGNKVLAGAIMFLTLVTLVWAIPFETEIGFSAPTRTQWQAYFTSTKFFPSVAPYRWSGMSLEGVRSVVYDTTTTARTIAQWETGTVFSNTTASSDDRLTFNLPAAKQGLRYSFIKGDSTSSSELWLTCSSGDTINAGTASKSYKITGTTQPQAATIVCTADGKWRIQSQVGTASNDNN